MIASVVRAETGLSYSVEIPPGATVPAVKEMLEKVCGVYHSDQIILLKNGSKLEDSKNIDAYPVVDEMYVFDRRLLDRTASVPPSPLMAPLSFNPSTPPGIYPLPDSPFVDELRKLYSQFSSNAELTKSVKAVMERRLELCRRVLVEVGNQTRALAAAMLNLEEHLKRTARYFGTLRETIQRQQQQHAVLLTSFPDDMKRLRATRVHEAIESRLNRRGLTLADLVPQQRLVALADELRAEPREVSSRLDKIKDEVAAILSDADSFRAQQPTVQYEEVERACGDAAAATSEIAKQSSKLSGDLERAAKDISVVGAQPSQQAAWDLSAQLEEVKKSQEVTIGLAKHLESESESTVKRFGFWKSQMTKWVVERLRKISEIQARIKVTTNTMIVIQEAAKRQAMAFNQLYCVHIMPNTYERYEQEVARRNSFRENMNHHIEEFIRQLNDDRATEVALRKEFTKKYLRYLPGDLQIGMADEPPAFELIPPAFDLSLPPIPATLAMPSGEQLPPFASRSDSIYGKDLSEADQLAQEMRQGLADSQQRLTVMESQLKRKAEEVEEAHRRAQEAKAELEEKLAQHVKESVICSSTAEKERELRLLREKEMDEIREKATQLQVQEQELRLSHEKELSAARENVSHLQKQLAEVLRESEQLKQRADEERQARESLESERESCKAQLLQLEKTLSESRSAAQIAAQQPLAEVRELRSEITSLRTRIGQLEFELKQAAEEGKRRLEDQAMRSSEELARLRDTHAKEIASMRERNEKELNLMRERNEKELARLTQSLRYADLRDKELTQAKKDLELTKTELEAAKKEMEITKKEQVRIITESEKAVADILAREEQFKGKTAITLKDLKAGDIALFRHNSAVGCFEALVLDNSHYILITQCIQENTPKDKLLVMTLIHVTEIDSKRRRELKIPDGELCREVIAVPLDD